MRFKRPRRRVPRNVHFVSNGHVGCPVTGGDVDVERCLACPSYVKLVEDAEVPYLICKGRSHRAELESLRGVI